MSYGPEGEAFFCDVCEDDPKRCNKIDCPGRYAGEPDIQASMAENSPMHTPQDLETKMNELTPGLVPICEGCAEGGIISYEHCGQNWCPFKRHCERCNTSFSRDEEPQCLLVLCPLSKGAAPK